LLTLRITRFTWQDGREIGILQSARDLERLAQSLYTPRMDCAHIAAELRRFFADPPPDLAAAYLFGSVARGTAREGSDVDVAVLLKQDPPRTLDGLHFDLEADLQDALDLPVQLVVLNRASPELAFQVLSAGCLLAEPDRSARVRFEVRARQEYWDFLPVLRLYRGLPREID
jgi:uncharacterized protein